MNCVEMYLAEGTSMRGCRGSGDQPLIDGAKIIAAAMLSQAFEFSLKDPGSVGSWFLKVLRHAGWQCFRKSWSPHLQQRVSACHN